MPDTIPRVRQIAVRLVIDPRFAPRVQVVAQLGAGRIEQRPDDRLPTRVDPAEAGQSGASNQLQQKRLCLVVARMADGNPVSPDVCRASVQEGVARAPRCLLDAQPLGGRVVSNISATDDERQIDPCREFAAELLVAVCGRAQTVVEVRQAGQTESTVRRQLPEDEGEGNRVRAARQGDEQTGSWRAEVVPPDRAPDLLEKCVSKLPTPQLRHFASFGGQPSRGLPSRSSDVGELRAKVWCRRADSNRRPRAYETRALTG